MKKIWRIAFAMVCCLAHSLAFGGTYAPRDGAGFMVPSSERVILDSDGKFLFSIDRDGSINNKSNPFRDGTSTPTKQFCDRIKETKPGVADESRPCDTLEEARMEAYAKVACKVAENRSVEYSSGIEFDPDSGKYYPIEPIMGQSDRVNLPSGQNVKETMHYHPSGKQVPSVGDLWSAKVPGIVLVGDGAGGLSDQVLRYDGKGNAAKLEIQSDGKGFKQIGEMKLADLCGEQDKVSWQGLMAKLSAESSRRGQDAILSQQRSDGSGYSNASLQACPDGSFDWQKEVRPQEPRKIGYVGNPSMASQARPSGTVNTAPAYQTYTHDNTAMKSQLSQYLESVYQYASGIAAEVGVGAEYQSAVAPVMSQGRAAISSIPDQQTYTIPASSSQGDGY